MTMKTNFNPNNKLPIWVAVWSVILAAGIILSIVFSVLPGMSVFNPTASISDTKSLVVSADAFVGLNDEYEEALLNICEKEIKAENLSVIKMEKPSSETGISFEFKFTANVDSSKLDFVGEKIVEAVKADSVLSENGVALTAVEYSLNDSAVQHATDYIWRAALSGGIMLVIAFAYIFVRYSLSIGLAALLGGIADAGMVLSLMIITRAPATTTLAVVAVATVLYSVLLSLVSFSGMRKVLKSEEYKDADIDESMAAATEQGMLPVLLLGASMVLISALLAIFAGEMVRSAAIAVIFGVVGATFSATCAKPALVTAFRKVGKQMKENKLAKQRAAEQK